MPRLATNRPWILTQIQILGLISCELHNVKSQIPYKFHYSKFYLDSIVELKATYDDGIGAQWEVISQCAAEWLLACGSGGLKCIEVWMSMLDSMQSQGLRACHSLTVNCTLRRWPVIIHNSGCQDFSLGTLLLDMGCHNWFSDTGPAGPKILLISIQFSLP